MTVTTETNLVPVEAPGAVSTHVAATPPVGMEDYDGSEFRLPRIQIVQTGDQMTEWDAKGGQFHNSVTGENLPKLSCIVIGVKKKKWWGPGHVEASQMREAGQKVEAYCKSSNGRTPDADVKKPVCSSCKICPNAKFQENPDGTKAAPVCTDIRSLLVQLEDGTVGTLTVRKTAVRDVDNFVQPFFLKGLNLFAFHAEITTRAEKGVGNTYYVPVLKPLNDKPVSAEEQAQLKETLEMYQALISQVSDDDTHGGEGATGGNDGAIDTTATHVNQAPPTPSNAASNVTPPPPPPDEEEVNNLVDDPDAPF